MSGPILDNVDLYSGDDLAQADKKSTVSLTQSRSKPCFLRPIFRDVRNARLRHLAPRTQWLEGIEPDSGDTLSILYKGTLRTLSYCAGAIYNSDEWDARAANSSVDVPDIVIADHSLCRVGGQKTLSFHTPQWVRQILRLSHDWSLTVASLKRGVRQEISRILRKHRYRVRTSSGAEAIASFYDDIFVPSMRERYGTSAVVATKPSFLAEARFMTRLDLLCGDDVVAASLLEIDERTLFIRKSASMPGRDELAGRADALDYYSLLLAQLLNCDVLDFGLSRPHLEDGVFRYKAKWGTELVRAGRLKANIRVAPQNFCAAVRGVLRRNYFLQQFDRGYVVRVLSGSSTDNVRLERAKRLADVKGLLGIELIRWPHGTEN